MQNLIDQFALYSLTPYRDFIHNNIWMMIGVSVINLIGWIKFANGDKYKSLSGVRILFLTHVYYTAVHILDIQYNPELSRLWLYTFFIVTVLIGMFYLTIDSAIKRWEEHNKAIKDNENT